MNPPEKINENRSVSEFWISGFMADNHKRNPDHQTDI